MRANVHESSLGHSAAFKIQNKNAESKAAIIYVRHSRTQEDVLFATSRQRVATNYWQLPITITDYMDENVRTSLSIFQKEVLINLTCSLY